MTKSVWVAVVAASLAMNARAADLPVSNPGFEETPGPDASPAPAWFGSNASSLMAVDDGVAHSGSRSLRLEYRPPFSGVTQVLDATAYRGRKVVLRAMLRSRELGAGSNGLWMRADSADGEVAAFEHSYRQPVLGTQDWTKREVELMVPASANRLMFGAVAGAEGTLWIDDIALSAPQMPELSAVAAARVYLDTALDLIQHQAYYADRLDWPKLREASHALARDARRPSDTYPAIRKVLAALADRHSHLVPPEEVANQQSEQVRGDYGVESSTLGTIGYVRVPGFAGAGRAPGAAFASQIRSAIRAQAAAGTCGWIVDLRGNMGGNMHPMLAGLRDLLGDGELGYFVNRAGRQPWRAMGNGKPALPDMPVAVLINGRTASSGEAVLLSFVGRPEARSFGSDTFGVSTVNTLLPLADGALMALTVGVQADRTGRTHGGVVAPDQVVQPAEGKATLENDPVVMAARSWLHSRPACATAIPNARLE
jgi:carboxyl-terminal processing protease